MNNKSLKAIALLSVFAVSLAATAVQLTPETTNEQKIRKDWIIVPSRG
jgi:propanediol dehydratase small subunit